MVLSGSQTRQPLGDSGAVLSSLPFFTMKALSLPRLFPVRKCGWGRADQGFVALAPEPVFILPVGDTVLSEECKKQRRASVREWKELTHGSSWFLVRKTRLFNIG